MKYLTHIFNFCRSVNTHCISELYLPEIKWPGMKNSVIIPLVFFNLCDRLATEKKTPCLWEKLWENSEKIAPYAENWLWKSIRHQQLIFNYLNTFCKPHLFPMGLWKCKDHSEQRKLCESPFENLNTWMLVSKIW